MLSKEHISTALSTHERKQISQDDFPGFAEAAVLIPLFPTEQGLSVLFTVRTNDVETHKGQISFPGGMRDSSDQDSMHTALREIEEEIGIQQKEITILGILDDHPVPSRYIITPVVGYLSKRPVCSPNPLEVAEIFEVPLAFFADDKNGQTEQRTFNDKQVTVWHFQFGKHLIWGATAAIVRNLIKVTSGEIL